jgi:hypothetical protein
MKLPDYSDFFAKDSRYDLLDVSAKVSFMAVLSIKERQDLLLSIMQTLLCDHNEMTTTLAY